MTTLETPELASAPDAPVGSLLAGRYRLDAVIGIGGMSTVYRATDETLGRTVAIKLLRRDVADADDVRRHSDEVRLVASLSHPSIVTLFDAVADDPAERAFLVLQLVDGTDLRDRLRQGPLDRRGAAAVGADIADALAYVHARGVIHRDLKPGNILVPAGTGRVTAMLTDFGIARLVDGSRLTATGSVLGTAAYLSPEQALGRPVTPATDVYSLGLVLIECLTGERVFPGSGLESAAARLSSDPRLPDQFGGEWTRLLRDLTERDPQDRPTAAEAAARLDALRDDEELDPTLRMPTADEPTAAMTPPRASEQATDVLAPAPAAVLAAPTTPLHPSGSAAPTVTATPATATPVRPVAGRRWTAAIVALLSIAGAAAIAIAAWGVSALLPQQPATAESGVVYPAVEGDVGAALAALQTSVQGAPALENVTLAITESAAGGDWATARSGLDQLATALTGMSDDRVAAVTAAADPLRALLDALLAPPPPAQEEDGGGGPPEDKGPPEGKGPDGKKGDKKP